MELRPGGLNSIGNSLNIERMLAILLILPLAILHILLLFFLNVSCLRLLMIHPVT